MKRHDTTPPLRVTLSDKNGAVDLSSATTVRLLMSNTDTQTVASLTMTKAADQVTNKGVATYQWQAADTAIAGVYSVEFEVTWGDGTIETFPNDGYRTIQIKEDLGP